MHLLSSISKDVQASNYFHVIGIIAYGASDYRSASIFYGVRIFFWLGAFGFSCWVTFSPRRQSLGYGLRILSLVTSFSFLVLTIFHEIYLVAINMEDLRLSNFIIVLLPILDSVANASYYTFAMLIASGYSLLRRHMRYRIRQLAILLSISFFLVQLVFSSLILNFQEAKRQQQNYLDLEINKKASVDAMLQEVRPVNLEIASTLNICYWLVTIPCMMYLVVLIFYVRRTFRRKLEKLKKSPTVTEARIYDLERRLLLQKGYVSRVVMYTSIKIVEFIISLLPYSIAAFQVYNVIVILDNISIMMHIMYTNTAFRPGNNKGLVVSDAIWEHNFDQKYMYPQYSLKPIKSSKSVKSVTSMQSLIPTNPFSSLYNMFTQNGTANDHVGNGYRSADKSQNNDENQSVYNKSSNNNGMLGNQPFDSGKAHRNGRYNHSSGEKKLTGYQKLQHDNENVDRVNIQESSQADKPAKFFGVNDKAGYVQKEVSPQDNSTPQNKVNKYLRNSLLDRVFSGRQDSRNIRDLQSPELVGLRGDQDLSSMEQFNRQQNAAGNTAALASQQQQDIHLFEDASLHSSDSNSNPIFSSSGSINNIKHNNKSHDNNRYNDNITHNNNNHHIANSKSNGFNRNSISNENIGTQNSINSGSQGNSGNSQQVPEARKLMRHFGEESMQEDASKSPQKSLQAYDHEVFIQGATQQNQQQFSDYNHNLKSNDHSNNQSFSNNNNKYHNNNKSIDNNNYNNSSTIYQDGLQISNGSPYQEHQGQQNLKVDYVNRSSRSMGRLAQDNDMQNGNMNLQFKSSDNNNMQINNPLVGDQNLKIYPNNTISHQNSIQSVHSAIQAGAQTNDPCAQSIASDVQVNDQAQNQRQMKNDPLKSDLQVQGQAIQLQDQQKLMAQSQQVQAPQSQQQQIYQQQQQQIQLLQQNQHQQQQQQQQLQQQQQQQQKLGQQSQQSNKGTKKQVIKPESQTQSQLSKKQEYLQQLQQYQQQKQDHLAQYQSRDTSSYFQQRQQVFQGPDMGIEMGQLQKTPIVDTQEKECKTRQDNFNVSDSNALSDNSVYLNDGSDIHYCSDSQQLHSIQQDKAYQRVQGKDAQELQQNKLAQSNQQYQEPLNGQSKYIVRNKFTNDNNNININNNSNSVSNNSYTNIQQQNINNNSNNSSNNSDNSSNTNHNDNNINVQVVVDNPDKLTPKSRLHYDSYQTPFSSINKITGKIYQSQASSQNIKEGQQFQNGDNGKYSGVLSPLKVMFNSFGSPRRQKKDSYVNLNDVMLGYEMQDSPSISRDNSKQITGLPQGMDVEPSQQNLLSSQHTPSDTKHLSPPKDPNLTLQDKLLSLKQQNQEIKRLNDSMKQGSSPNYEYQIEYVLDDMFDKNLQDFEVQAYPTGLEEENNLSLQEYLSYVQASQEFRKNGIQVQAQRNFVMKIIEKFLPI